MTGYQILLVVLASTLLVVESKPSVPDQVLADVVREVSERSDVPEEAILDELSNEILDAINPDETPDHGDAADQKNGNKDVKESQDARRNHWFRGRPVHVHIVLYPGQQTIYHRHTIRVTKPAVSAIHVTPTIKTFFRNFMIRFRFPNIQFKNLQANGKFEFHFGNNRPTAHGYITKFTTKLITGMITFADRYNGKPVHFWLYPAQRTIYFVKQHGNDKWVAQPVPVEGGWSDWRVNEDCPPCGSSGTKKYFIRSCTNPAPKDGGKECEGDYGKEEECTNLSPCKNMCFIGNFKMGAGRDKHEFGFMSQTNTDSQEECEKYCKDASGCGGYRWVGPLCVAYTTGLLSAPRYGLDYLVYDQSSQMSFYSELDPSLCVKLNEKWNNQNLKVALICMRAKFVSSALANCSPGGFTVPSE